MSQRTVGWVILNMEDTETSNPLMPRSTSCDYQALKDCLEKNRGDRSKCVKEWEEFQRSCAEKNKR